jgi:Uma2 family endonuclease
MPTATGLVTVEDFAKLPKPTDGTYLELHHGEVTHLTFPKPEHRDIQHRLYDMLKPIASAQSVVQLELPFRAVPQHDLRAADLGIVSRERYRATKRGEYLSGAPDMVIEVESPSNTAAELDDKEALCLASGCRELWIVYSERKLVRVTTGETVKRYKEGESIPLSLFPSQSIPVSDIFTDVLTA